MILKKSQNINSLTSPATFCDYIRVSVTLNAYSHYSFLVVLLPPSPLLAESAACLASLPQMQMSWLVALAVAVVFVVYYALHSKCHRKRATKCQRCQQLTGNSLTSKSNELRHAVDGDPRKADGISLCRSSTSLINLVEVYPNEQMLSIKSDQFRTYMQLCTEFVIDYLGKNEHQYNVTTDFSPGFLTEKLPTRMPRKPEKFSKILDDIYQQILPGITHWQHPRFHAYFPHGCSYPDIIGEVLVSSIGVVQFSWDSSPALTELEIVIVNWLGGAIGLPDQFLFNVECPNESPGGGALQASSSDAVFLAMLAAREKKLSELVGDRHKEPDYQKRAADYLSLLVAYASTEAHSCVEKAARLVMVNFRCVESDHEYQMTGRKLEAEIGKDLQRGLIPFFVCATSGTTSVASFDNLGEIAEKAKKYTLWMHVDGSYGVCARICPEFRYLTNDIEKADSINMNAHKLLLASCTSSILWTRNQKDILAAYMFDGEYLRKSRRQVVDFRHWGISLSRRAKALKLWVLFRMYGLSGLQDYVRRLVRLADRFSDHLNIYEKIFVVTHQLTLVTFRVVADSTIESNKLTIALCEHVNRSRKILVTHAKPQGKDVIRVCICQERSTNEDIDKSWKVLKGLLDEFFGLDTVKNHGITAHPSSPDLYEMGDDLMASPVTVQSTESSSNSLLSSMNRQSAASTSIIGNKWSSSSGRKQMNGDTD